jgi:hypothetical protein
MKALEKALAVRRNWPFRSPDPRIAYRNRIRRAHGVLTLIEKHGSSQVRYEARRLFIVAVCAAFEAFWRDIVRDAIDEGGISLKSAPQLGKVTFSVSDLSEVLGQRLTLGELVSAAYTFQSPEAVDQALSEVLGIKAFAEFAKWELKVREVPRKNRSRKRGPLLKATFKGDVWLKAIPNIHRAFAVRHDTVHDTGARHWLTTIQTHRLQHAVWEFNEFFSLFIERRLDGMVVRYRPRRTRRKVGSARKGKGRARVKAA